MTQNTRNINLDILRIIAALMVLTVHVGYEFPWIADYTWYGYYGNTLFFALSGYLIMASAAKCTSVIDFYKNRVIRILPLYWSILIFTYITNMIKGLIAGTPGLFSANGICSVRFLRYFIFAQMFIPSDNFGLWNNYQGLWPMSSFIFFYLLAPIIYKLITKYYVAFAMFIAMLFAHDPFVALLEKSLASSARNYSEAYNFASWFPLSTLYCFFAGVVIYLAVKENRHLSFAIFCILAMIYNSFEWFAWDLGLIMLVYVAVVTPSVTINNKLLNSIIRTCSDFSFSLYLTHILVLGYVMPLRDSLVPFIKHKGFLCFVFVACIAIGYLVWRYIEKPLTKYITRKL